MRNFNFIIRIAVLALLVSCNRFEPVDHVFDNCAYLDVSATSQTQAATFGNRVGSLEKHLCVALSYPSDKDVKATISVDASLTDAFNHRYGTDYQLLPEAYLDFSPVSVTIEAGKVNSEKVSIGFKNLMGQGEDQTGAMEIDKTYLLPVRLSSEDISTMDGSSVAYYLVKRSSAITVAAQLTDNWIEFPLMDTPGEVADAYNGLTALTYEALVNVDRFDLNNKDGVCNISTVMGVEQYLLLRIGDANFERQCLQFDGSGNGSQFGKLPSKSDPAKKLYSGSWYHVACTYDQNERVARIYVNGKLIDEVKEAGVAGPTADNKITLAMRALGMPEAYQFFIGKSYNDFRPLQGKIAEARVWRVARTGDEIWKNMYRIENPKDQKDLIGYWKFNDGEGNVVKDYSWVGNHGKAVGDIIWPDGIEIHEINKEEE
ncbi:MAG: DUF1735 and LamG domain-containing protein [Bacteroidales bacterium]|jgi:hypothetical protein|uniref:DUF1735 and LamG domain-containing protein n=1 Tax=Candidatus Cryptobacteroides bacterium TaxID=3085639 RepID=UPI002E982F1E|nr:DUF1735 and LamG domain-containing protein [Bacteroidales bacterium]